MNRETARTIVKEKLPEYLDYKGINTRKNFHCPDPAHHDSTPSASFDRANNKVHCFGCGKTFDTIDLMAIDTGMGVEDKALWDYAYKFFSLNVDTEEGLSFTGSIKSNKSDREPVQPAITETAPAGEPQGFSAYYAKCAARIGETTYHRGISLETLKRYNIGFDPAWNHPTSKNIRPAARLIIPISEYSYAARATDPNNEVKKVKAKAPGVDKVNWLFNVEAAFSQEEAPIFVVEGEIDALSIIDVGGVAIGLGSIANRKCLVDYIRERRITPAYPMILCPDNDNSGLDGMGKLKDDLTLLGIATVTGEVNLTYKDANEAYMKEPDRFRNAIQAASGLSEENKEDIKLDYIIANSVLNDILDYMDTRKEAEKVKPLSTGLSCVDRLLDGGLYKGLYFIGAISGLGKTTMCLQIADHIAASGTDVLIFSLEMDKHELLSKSVSRETARISNEKFGTYHHGISTRDAMNAQRKLNERETDLLCDALERCMGYADKIFISVGVGDIGTAQVREEVQRHITATGHRPVIIIDYLQILAPEDSKSTDKQNTDKAVIELKRLSRDIDTPVLVVSSFNRENYTEPVSKASFKESGAVEYTSDVLIGLQYEGMDYQKGEEEKGRKKRIRELIETQENLKREGNAQALQLKVLKNRNGLTGSCELDFYSRYNLYTERKTDKTDTRWREI